MKKIRLHLLLIIFTFSQVYGMDHEQKFFSFPSMHNFIKENPIATLIAAIGIPAFLLLCYRQFKIFHTPAPPKQIEKLFWLQENDGKPFPINISEAKKYPVLKHYIDRFGYANAEASPLKIQSKDSLDELTSAKLQNFLQSCLKKRSAVLEQENQQRAIITTKKMKEAFEIDELLLGSNVSQKIVQYLQDTLEDINLSIVFKWILYHNTTRNEDYSKKIFFNNKNFYWQKENWLPVFYDQNDREVFRLVDAYGAIPMSGGERFIPAYNANAFLIALESGIKVYNLETKTWCQIDGSFDNFELSPDGRYVAVRFTSRPTTIDLYDIKDSNGIIHIAEFDHVGLRDFVFSPDGSKLISWGRSQKGEVILWDLQDVSNVPVEKKILYSSSGFTHIIFNTDNVHICMITSDNFQCNTTTGKCDKGDGVLLNINNPDVPINQFQWDYAHIFPHNSDVVIFKDQAGYERLFTKAGTKLELPRSMKESDDYHWDVNQDYILAVKKGKVSLFDHEMNCIAYLSGYDGTKPKLGHSCENVIIAANKKNPKDAFCCPLPDKETVKTIQLMSKQLTVAQYMFLEEVCTLKRQETKHIKLEKESLLNKALMLFKDDKQTFLKQKLLITEQ